jgi:hypothetical protein
MGGKFRDVTEELEPHLMPLITDVIEKQKIPMGRSGRIIMIKILKDQV